MGDALTLPFATHSFTFFRNLPLVQNAANGGFKPKDEAALAAMALVVGVAGYRECCTF
jgi:hypothetical protein